MVWYFQVGIAVLQAVHDNICDIHSLFALALEDGFLEDVPL